MGSGSLMYYILTTVCPYAYQPIKYCL